MIFFARPTRVLVDDESFVLFLAQTSVTSHPITPQLCPLHRQKQPSPRPVIPSVCLALARLAVIARQGSGPRGPIPASDHSEPRQRGSSSRTSQRYRDLPRLPRRGND